MCYFVHYYGFYGVLIAFIVSKFINAEFIVGVFNDIASAAAKICMVI